MGSAADSFAAGSPAGAVVGVGAASAALRRAGKAEKGRARIGWRAGWRARVVALRRQWRHIMAAVGRGVSMMVLCRCRGLWFGGRGTKVGCEGERRECSALEKIWVGQMEDLAEVWPWPSHTVFTLGVLGAYNCPPTRCLQLCHGATEHLKTHGSPRQAWRPLLPIPQSCASGHPPHITSSSLFPRDIRSRGRTPSELLPKVTKDRHATMSAPDQRGSGGRNELHQRNLEYTLKELQNQIREHEGELERVGIRSVPSRLSPQLNQVPATLYGHPAPRDLPVACRDPCSDEDRLRRC